MLDESSMAALLETFLLESEEGLEATEGALLALERDPEDAEALALAFRGVHTIKGNAGIFDFDGLGTVAHSMEDLLDGVRSGQTSCTPAVMGILFDSIDTLRSLLAEERTRGVKGASPVAAQRKTHTLRIDIERLDRLMDLSGEIGVARGRIAQMLEDPSIPARVTLEAHRDADLLHLEMQELVMKLRMVPVGPGFRQLHRTVRDAAHATGRNAELVIEGDEVEVDMAIVEHLRDPLIHMIRNSVAHGIESAEVRRAAGKPAAGQLRLRSFHDSGSIVIELSDDGAGIDRKRVAERAVERGLIADGHALSEGEVIELLFHPGFSTAAKVTELSGRGVGLDVVRRNIDAIHGSVTVQSRPGEGTTITLRLPLTLAIVDGLLVRVAEQPFIIPMDLVVEAVRMPFDLDSSRATGVLTHRDESIPFLRLRNRLACNSTDRDSTERRLPGGRSAGFQPASVPRAAGRMPADRPAGSRRSVGAAGSVGEDDAGLRENVVVVRHAGALAGLVVDVLDGECQTVVKPLPRSLRGIPGLSGSTILANGAVAFIVDVFALLQVEIDRGRASSTYATRTNQEPSCSPN